MSQATVEHEFVEFVPEVLEQGKLYISIPYNTAVHRCACGCGSKITTPLSPFQWQLTYDGETVSLTPSMGNWSYPCQSHYWIKHDRVEWAPQWSRERIKAARVRDRQAKTHHDEPTGDMPSAAPPRDSRWAILRKLWRWARRRDD